MGEKLHHTWAMFIHVHNVYKRQWRHHMQILTHGQNYVEITSAIAWQSATLLQRPMKQFLPDGLVTRFFNFTNCRSINTFCNKTLPIPIHTLQQNHCDNYKFEIISPRPLHTALDREHFLITDKHTEILDCIPCVVAIFLSTRQAEPIYRPLRGTRIV